MEGFAGRKVIYKEITAESVLRTNAHVDGGWFWSKYSASPYRGCQYGCTYCFLREKNYGLTVRDKETQGLDDPFSQFIRVQVNAAEVLDKELERVQRDIIIAGDYQPAESKYRISRKLLQVCLKHKFPAMVVAKSPLVLSDADVLQQLSKESWACVVFSVSSAASKGYLGFFEPLRSLFINAFTLKKTLVSGRKLNKKIKEAIKDLDDQPFFLWLHYMDSHLPYLNGLGPSFFNKNNKLKKLIKRIIFYMSLSTSVRRMSLSNSTLIEIFKEAYRTSVKYLDKCLKEIIDFILKKYPNTIIVIASDHGEAFMEHDFFAHEPMSLHNEIIKVPLMFYIPKNKPKIIKNTVSLVSVAKTIASLVGINELKFQGDDLLKNKNYSLINNISRILYNCRSPHVRLGILDNKTEIKGKYTQLWSFTTPKEKYIYELDGNRREFYDLDKDPLEKKNLYSDKIKSRIINQLEEMVHKTK